MGPKNDLVIVAHLIRPEFFYKLIYGNFFSDLGSAGRKKINKKALKMTTGHFQSFFFYYYFFNISKKKTVKLVR